MKLYIQKSIVYFALLVFSTSFVQAKDSAIIVFDGSGSMWGQIKGKTKIEIARDVMGTLIKDWNKDVELGLIAYGHREKGNCQDIEVLQPVSAIDSKKILQSINKISPKGKTPISRSLRKAAETLRYKEDSATVILISDGEETCKADPCAVSKELEKQGINFTAHVIGFDIKNNKKARRQLKCIADNTGGQFYEAEDAASLKKSLIKVKQAVVEAPPTVDKSCKNFERDFLPKLLSKSHDYYNKTSNKALVVARHEDGCYTFGWSAGQTNEKQAIKRAFRECQKYKVKKNKVGTCELYLKNNTIVSSHLKQGSKKIKTVVIKAGIGTLQLANNKENFVKVIDQKTGKKKATFGYTQKRMQLRAGMYKLKFDNYEIDDIEVKANKKNIVDISKHVGWINLANNREEFVKVLDHKTGKEKVTFGYTIRTLQLPVGKYKLKFENYVLDDIVVTAGQKLVVDIGQ